MAKPAHTTTADTEWDRDAALDHRAHPAGDQGGQFPPGGAVHLHLGLEVAGLYRLPPHHLLPAGALEDLRLAVEKINRHVGFESIETIAGGETAGIPFAAFIADRMNAPMSYVRRSPRVSARTR